MIDLIYFLRVRIITIGVISSIISFLEIKILVHLKDNFYYLLTLGFSEFVAILSFVLLYIIIISINLLLVYFIRKAAFTAALERSLKVISDHIDRSILFQDAEVSSMLGIEKERLAKEIIYPMFLVVQRSMLPIIALYELRNVPVSLLSSYFGPLLLVIATYVLCSLLFRKYALQLQAAIEGLAKRNHTYTKMYRAGAFRMNDFLSQKSLTEHNDDLAKVEAKIDVVSQAPRASIDLYVAIFVISSYVYTQDDQLDLTSLLVASPVVARAASNIQQIYKSLASIISNARAIKILNVSGAKRYQNSDAILEVNLDGILGQNNKVIGVSFPSGFGKTNAVLNLLYGERNNYSSLAFNTTLDRRDIAFIPAEPYFDDEMSIEIQRNSLISFDVSSGLTFKKPPVANQCSQGELFRAQLVTSLMSSPKLLIIDESLSYIDKERRLKLFEYFRKQSNMSVIIITHNKDIMHLCDKIIDHAYN